MTTATALTSPTLKFQLFEFSMLKALVEYKHAILSKSRTRIKTITVFKAIDAIHADEAWIVDATEPNWLSSKKGAEGDFIRPISSRNHFRGTKSIHSPPGYIHIPTTKLVQ